MSHRPPIIVHDDIPDDAGELIDAGPDASNHAAAPLHDVRPLSGFSRVGEGSAPVVIGGTVGRTGGACCELQQLRVAPAHRRRGIGADLVRGFEQRLAQGVATRSIWRP